jgi:hypothetical protein
MPANYVLLEKITVGAAGASSVTFSGIPQTGYTDLVIKGTARGTAGTTSILNVSFNGSTSNFTDRYIEGNGASVGSFTDQPRMVGLVNGTGATANTFTNFETYIPNYTSANYKSFSADIALEDNTTTAYLELQAGLWSNTAAITSMALAPLSGSFVQYSTFYLYGVAKLGTTPAIVPYATGGDTIMTDGTYWYHAFKASGTFTPAKALSCDVLVVAGGGGGGPAHAGGGGAGGLLAYSAQSIGSGSAQTVTIGAGGAGAAYPGTSSNGSNSQFASLTASVGGGYGGRGYLAGQAGATGGSGGGGGTNGGTAGAATSGQGFAGGAGTASSNFGGGGGGGGAAAAGSNASAAVAPSAQGGAGGTASSAYSSWLNATGTGVSGAVAGGGGGGSDTGTVNASGGGGGAGNGTYSGTGGSATANTGSGGGGGGGGGGAGGSGGSGIVIVRYAV